MAPSLTATAANEIPAAAIALLSPAQRRAIQAAAIGPTDEAKTDYCEQCRRHTGPSSPLCDRCTMVGLLGAIAFLGDLLAGTPQPAAPTDDEPSAINVEGIARITHEVNRAYCAAGGDFSQPAWEDAPDWQRQSAIAGVQAVIAGTAKTPEEQHQAWMDHKLAEGWTYGDEKDPEAKTHPCLVPYDQLPPEQQAKDHLFRAVVVAAFAEGPKQS